MRKAGLPLALLAIMLLIALVLEQGFHDGADLWTKAPVALLLIWGLIRGRGPGSASEDDLLA